MKTPKEYVIEHPFFAGMRPQHLEILATGATQATFEAGQIIFREDEPAGHFYLIGKGRVCLEAHEPADGTVPIQTIGPGEVLGWSWLFPPFSWHLQARAVEPVEAVVLDGAHLLVTAEKDKAFGYELMKRVAQVVIHRLQSTRKRLAAQQMESALEG
jgi:CRP-like cAMP-binding protein